MIVRLFWLRKSISYDVQSGGIQRIAPEKVGCRMGGEAETLRLETAYVEYVDHEAEPRGLRPVYTKGLNCLYAFEEKFRPKKKSANDNAHEIAIILETIGALTSSGE